MPVPPLYRDNVEFIKNQFRIRLGDDYVYGGTWDPQDASVGADCSGLVTDVLSGSFEGPRMIWGREGLSTESYRYKNFGEQQVGPFTLIHVSSPNQIPPDAAMRIDLHHEGAGGPDSHMHCVLDGVVMESNGDAGCCTLPGGAISPNSSYWNDWWYIPGPILGGVAPPVAPSDTLWADVSEFQNPVDDSYWNASFTAGNGVSSNFNVLSIRSNDGGHEDDNFATNYRRCVDAVNSGRCKFFIVYFYWRPGATDVDTHMRMVSELGGPHPKMVSMMDVESGGNPGGDASPELNAEYNRLVGWLSDQRRVIGYANLNDEKTLWQLKPQHVPFILAGYGANPDDPNVFKIGHQYTDGQGYGDGLPEGAPPFGNCDMNSADGFSPDSLAAALGVGDPGGYVMPDGSVIGLNDAQRVVAAADKILATGQPNNQWQSRGMFVTRATGVDDTTGMVLNIDGNSWNILVIIGYLLGVTEDSKLITDAAQGKFPDNSFVDDDAWLKARATEFAEKLIQFKQSFLAGPGSPAPGSSTPAKPVKPKKGKS